MVTPGMHLRIFWISSLIPIDVLMFRYFLYEKALASEKELVLALLDPDAVTDTGPTARRFSKNAESDPAKTEPDITFILDRIFEGACRPFKVRVEQVLQSQPSLIVSYKLSNTLEFYSYTVSCDLFLLYLSMQCFCCIYHVMFPLSFFFISPRN